MSSKIKKLNKINIQNDGRDVLLMNSFGNGFSRNESSGKNDQVETQNFEPQIAIYTDGTVSNTFGNSGVDSVKIKLTKSDITELDNNLRAENLRKGFFDKSKKSKNFSETMENIYKDLGKTLEEIGNTQMETPLEPAKRFEFTNFNVQEMIKEQSESGDDINSRFNWDNVNHKKRGLNGKVERQSGEIVDRKNEICQEKEKEKESKDLNNLFPGESDNGQKKLLSDGE